ncbi:MAG TPA: hypothetical protein VIH36_07265, partial [Casimicrobiaceae bacterium]
QQFERFAASHPVAGDGWQRGNGIIARGIAERADDYCATAYIYCREPHPVPRVDIALATADIARRTYERASGFEALFT